MKGPAESGVLAPWVRGLGKRSVWARRTTLAGHSPSFGRGQAASFERLRDGTKLGAILRQGHFSGRRSAPFDTGPCQQRGPSTARGLISLVSPRLPGAHVTYWGPFGVGVGAQGDLILEGLWGQAKVLYLGGGLLLGTAKGPKRAFLLPAGTRLIAGQ